MSESLQARDGIGMATICEQCLEPSFYGAEIGLGQSGECALGDFVVGDLGKRVSHPQRHRGVEGGQGVLVLVVPQVRPSTIREDAQLHGIDRFRRHGERVALSLGDQGAAGPLPPSEGLANGGHVRP
jgi:hypothetical protein